MWNNAGKTKERQRARWTKIAFTVVAIAVVLFITLLLQKKLRLFLNYENRSKEFSDYAIVPEYDRYLKKVVLSLGATDMNLELQHELLLSLPNYTQILLLLPKRNLPIIEKELRGQPYAARTQLVPFKVEQQQNIRYYLVFPDKDKLQYGDPGDALMNPRGTVWTQDLFEIIEKPNGQKLLIISDAHKWFTSYGDLRSAQVVSDNAYLEALTSNGIDIQRSKLTFAGGNILFDNRDGKSLVLWGGDMLRKTVSVWRATRNSIPTESLITDILKETLNADETIVIGREHVQPSLMYHLDQAMIFLADGVVGITHVVGEYPEERAARVEIEKVEHFQTELRSVLLKSGYKVINIDTSVNNILNYQYYVNAIPYIDAKNNQRKILMPVYRGGQFEEELERKNSSIFESLGYEITQVYSRAHENNGGIHCLVNVLE